MWSSKLKVFWDALQKEYFRGLIFAGLRNTLLVAVVGLVIGVVIGSVIAIIKVAPKYKRVMRVLDRISTVYVAIFRGTPIVVQLVIAYYVILPACGAMGVNAVTVGAVVFGMNSGAYVSEMMRGGLNSVDPGQLESARAVGLSYSVSMLKIVIPQAFKNILPSIGNEFISLIKETSVLSFIAVYDLYSAFNSVGTNTYEHMIPYIAMALIYIILVLGISLLVKLMEKYLSRSDRQHRPVRS